MSTLSGNRKATIYRMTMEKKEKTIENEKNDKRSETEKEIMRMMMKKKRIRLRIRRGVRANE